MTREREPKAKRERLTELMQGAKRVAVSLAAPKKGISSEVPFVFEHGDFSRAQSLKSRARLFAKATFDFGKN